MLRYSPALAPPECDPPTCRKAPWPAAPGARASYGRESSKAPLLQTAAAGRQSVARRKTPSLVCFHCAAYSYQYLSQSCSPQLSKPRMRVGSQHLTRSVFNDRPTFKDEDVADWRSQCMDLCMPQVDPAQAYLASLRIVQAEEQSRNSRLAAPRLAQQPQRSTRLKAEGQVLKGTHSLLVSSDLSRQLILVGEIYCAKLHRKRTGRNDVCSILEPGTNLHQFTHASNACVCPLQVLKLRADGLDGCCQHHRICDHQVDCSKRDCPTLEQAAAQPVGNGIPGGKDTGCGHPHRAPPYFRSHPHRQPLAQVLEKTQHGVLHCAT